MSIVITIVLSYVFLFVLGRGIGLMRLLRLEMPKPYSRIISDSTSDAEEESVYASAHTWLLDHGFHKVARVQLSPSLKSSSSTPRTARYYLNADSTILCLLMLGSQQTGNPYRFLFISKNAQQEILQTSNRVLDASFPAAPGHTVQDCYFDNDEAPLELHRKSLSSFQAQPFSGVDDILAQSEANDTATLDFHEQSGWIKRSAEGYKLTLKGAWTCLGLAQQHQARLRKLPPMQSIASAAAEEAGEQAFIRNVIAVTRPENNKSARRRKTLIFLVTLGAFLVFGNFQWNLTTLLALIVVLFLHELGHFLAMRACGYRDVSIFFLPLLGAATSGRHDHASPWQKFFVFLAGPVPGMMLAFTILWLLPLLSPTHAEGILSSQHLLTFITLLLVINYLNLLPVTPFDGGRVMEILFLSRFPLANFIFYTVCVIAFGVAWHYTRDTVLLVLLFALGIGLPSQWRIARVSRILRPEFGRHPQEDAAIKTLAMALARPELKALSVSTRTVIVQALMPRLQQAMTPWRTTLAGGLIYFSLLCAPLLLLVPGLSASSMLPGVGSLVSRYATDEYLKELEARLTAAKTPLQKLVAYTELADYQQEMDVDEEGSEGQALYIKYAELAVRSITPDLDGTPEAADARMVYADSLAVRDEQEKALSLYAEAYEKLQHTHPEEHSRLGNILSRQENLLPATASPESRIALLQASYGHYEKSDNPAGLFFPGEKLAKLWHGEGNEAAAESVLRAMLKQTPPDAEDEYWRRRNNESLAWLLITSDRAVEAVSLLQPLPDNGEYFDDMPRTLAWAQLEAGLPEAARKTLQTAQDKRRHSLQSARHRYQNDRLAMYLIDDVLTYQKQQDEKGTLAARERLIAFLGKNKVDGNSIARGIDYRLQNDWSKPLLEAELRLLKSMGFSEISQCEPGTQESGKAAKS